jgi:DNA-binding NtrC family response regulator
MPAVSVLVVDDEAVIRDTLAEFLTAEGFAVKTAATGEAGVRLAEAGGFDVALCDLHLPGMDGLEVLDRLAAVSPDTAVVLVTAYGTVETAVEAFQKGAADYLMKPVILGEVATKVRRLVAQRDVVRENRSLRRELSRVEAAAGQMVAGRSAGMRQALDLARKVGPTPSTVLILGESGTGKELLARAVHQFGQAAKPTDGRFIALNCAAIPGDLLENQLFGHKKGAFTGADKDSLGVFRHAGDGTVFLDEVGEMPLGTQAKLLRVIEQKEVFPVGADEPVTVRARVLAATNKNLQAEADAGRFRPDLFYRLNVLSITLPPLRERREDIPELAAFLLAKHAKAMGKRVTGLTNEALAVLTAAPWKGNVRELDNALQRAVILGDGPLVTPADLPPDLLPAADDPGATDDLNDAVARFERGHIARVLRASPDKREAARRLNIGVSSLYRKIEQLGLGQGERGA